MSLWTKLPKCFDNIKFKKNTLPGDEQRQLNLKDATFHLADQHAAFLKFVENEFLCKKYDIYIYFFYCR